jgi:type VI secretion system secreted protein VgrG
MRQDFTQQHVRIAISTGFGKDKLLLESFSGTEALSQPFAFSLSMKSSDVALDPDAIVGTLATVKVIHGDGMTRYFHGLINGFTQAGIDAEFAWYSAEMVPSLWLLSLSRDRRIYQNQSTVQIVESVLQSFNIKFDNRLKASYATREYCVQYDETPLDFIMRLMAQEGIFYFFQFADGSHTLVLGDDPSAHRDCEHGHLIYRGRADTRGWADTMLRFEAGGRLVTRDYNGRDYDYLKPSTSLAADASGKAGRGKFYQYPHLHNTVAAGKQQQIVHVQASQSEASTAAGESLCNSLYAGGAFSLSKHPNNKLNARYVMRSVSHRADLSGYTNHFEAFPGTLPFRPPRSVPQPVVPGSHSAFVVGPEGEEIWTDLHGRVKVKFHWDQSSTQDDKASCWVRVSQAWAGNGWGALFIPRIGQEVIISYLDGNPDRPLITGSVYNGEQATPVNLPSKQMQSVIRSRPTKSGNGRSKTTEIEDGRMHGNELRFDDKIGDEELYLHAEHDMKIDIEHDLDSTLYTGSETHLVKKGNRSIEVTKGDETHTVGGKRDLTIHGDETHSDSMNFTHTVKKNYTLEVDGDLEETIKGNTTLKITGNLVIDVGGSITIKSGKNSDLTAGTAINFKAGTELSSQAGTSYAIKAGTELKLDALTLAAKASASGQIDGGGMLTIKGGMVKIN